MPDKKQHPVVLRFESILPSQLSRIAMHGKRSGGPMDNIEREFSHRNRVLVGANFVKDIKAELRELSRQNLREELDALERAGRRAKREERQEIGLRDPWHANSTGPLREFVLTANRDHFAAAPGTPERDVLTTYGVEEDGTTRVNRMCRNKIEAFVELSEAFFETHFPGQLRHLRLDLDEETPHLHGVVMVVTEKVTKARGTQRLVQPSANPLLKDYEHAQDVAGQFFAGIGLTRGKRDKEARRKAAMAGEPVPLRKRHVPPRKYREARAAALARREREAAARLTAARETQAKAEEDARATTARADKTANAIVASATQKADAMMQIAREGADEMIQVANASASATIAAADRKLSRASTLVGALKAGFDALVSGELEYDDGGRTGREGLRRGREGPKDRPAMERLRQLVLPARNWLVPVARRLAALDRRTAELAARDALVTLEASEVVETARLIGEAAPTRVANLARRHLGVGYTLAAHRDAWALPPEPVPGKVIDAFLAGMTNQRLRQHVLATRDTALLYEEDAGVRSDLGRGLAVLNEEARRRGYEPETDVHRPERATDPKRARLHEDTGHFGIHVKRYDRQRVRVRDE